MQHKTFWFIFSIFIYAPLIASALPITQFTQNVHPFVDNTYDLGTSTLRYIRIFLGTGTSTAANGWNITDGCFAVNGSCLPTTGVSGTGVANRLAYFSGASSLTSDADFIVDGDLGRLTATYASSTFITTTYASTTAVSFADEVWVTPLTSALLQTDSVGLLSEYAGTSCTNQFIRSLSALGAATCETIVAGDVDLADLTATNGTLTFSGTYDGQVARTIGLNLGNENLWTASSTFPTLNANAIYVTASSTLNTLNVNTARIASTTIQSLNANQCSGDACGELYSFTIASSSSLFNTFVPLPPKAYAYTITRLSCYVVGGTSKAAIFSDGTNDADTLTCATTLTSDDGSIANNTVTPNELTRVKLQPATGAVDTLSFTVFGIRGQ